MKSYKNILYAVDFGVHEKTVRNRVKFIKHHFNPKLSIVHVVESLPVFMDMSGFINNADILEKIRVEATSQVNKIAKDLEISEDNQHIIVGAPKSDIVALAKEINADLIILGAHNHHIIDNLIGSTTDAVLRAARCDVLAVKYKE